MDINEQVLAAFQAEHKEHIEGIRSLLGQLRDETLQPGDARLDEAFRLAHSLKGGARVCDLRPAEKLGHQLESLFASLRQGELPWQSHVAQVVNQVLDLIEDWMAALAEDQTPPDTSEALQALDSLLGADCSPCVSRGGGTERGLADELRSAFCEEHGAYVAGLREFLTQTRASAPEAADAEMAFRHAHALHSAAHAAELADVEALAWQIVDVLARVRKAKVPCDEKLRSSVTQLLDRIQAAVDVPSENQARRAASAAEGYDSTISESPAEGDQEASQRYGRESQTQGSRKLPAAGETLRVETGSLDRLIHCSGQLIGEIAVQDELTSDLQDFGRQLESMRREREHLRGLASGVLHQLDSSPQLRGLVSYFNVVDRQLETLMRRARTLGRVQHRRQWQLRNRSRQLHQAARQARMVPVESVFQGFRKMVRDLARDEKKLVDFTLRGLEHRVDRLVLQTLKDPLMHVLRNAVVHGVESPAQRAEWGKSETGAVELLVERAGNCLRIVASDDGRGLDWEAVRSTAVKRGLNAKEAQELDHDELARLILKPGFTTAQDVSELAGRGMGLSVLHAAVKRLQGEIRLDSRDQQGTRVELVIPLSVSTHRVLLVRAAGQNYVLPTSAVERLLRVSEVDIETLEGSPFISYGQRPIPLVTLAELLGVELPHAVSAGKFVCVVVVRSKDQLLAVAVDALLAQHDLMVHELTGPAAQTPYFSGAVLLDGGEVALLLDPAAIAETPSPKSTFLSRTRVEAAAADSPPEVLVVDDSFTTRTLEKSILEAHGYCVHIAVDGVEALSLLRSHRVDLVICDVEMPRMNGFELLTNVKADNQLRKLPFILVTSRDKVEDRENGLKLGADAYILKQKFDHQSLLDTIKRIL